MIAGLLSVDPKQRPSAKKLLESDVLRQKAAELGITLQKENQHASMLLQDAQLSKEGLLQTIHVPKVLANLSQQLPKSNYSASQSQRRNQRSGPLQ